MFLPLPTLDDRRWVGLVEEARALIPLYAPDWTDHNVSDPGITFVELFAWIAEMELFQLDQIPAGHRLKFLALLGIRPLPPAPARTVLRFAVPPGTPPVTLPAGIEGEGRDPYGDPVRVRTRYPLHVVATGLQRIQAHDGRGTTDLTDRWRRGEPFEPFGPDPRPGAALVLELSAPPPPAVPLSIALTPANPPDRVEGEHHSARTVWELRVGADHWQRLSTVDGTRSLTRSGRLTLTVPAGAGTPAGTTAYLRCRLVAGAYDEVPLLRDLAINGVPAVQSVPVGELNWVIVPGATVTGTAAPGTDANVALQLDEYGQIVHLDFSDRTAPVFGVLSFRAPAAGAAGWLSVEASVLGAGTGAPGQVVSCEPAPVEADSLRLYTLEGVGPQTVWRSWEIRPDLDASTPADTHAVLDPTTGALTFGSGRRGLAVPEGAAIVTAYRTTRAGAGALAAGTVDALADSPHNRALLAAAAVDGRLLAVTNPVPVAGGAAAETLEHAEGRAAELAVQPTRAVTTADYETLARQTPGVRLARVTALANTHPGFPCVVATGVITVVVLPYLPLGRPVPSRGMRRAVAAQLDHLRLVGTRVEVTGPTYTEVAVRTRVLATPTADRASLVGRVAEALDTFFDPLRGGPDSTGWPLGRDVYRLEVMQVVDEVPGVDHVLELELLVAGVAECGNACLGPIGLVAAGVHEIEVVGP